MYFALALGRGELEDQHVLGHPALVARHRRGDPQREALLAEQGVAAVARAVGPDLAASRGSGRCTCCRGAGPRHVLCAVLERHPDRVQAGDEVAVTERVERRLAHPGHDPHRHGHVRRVGQLHAHVGDRRADRPHREGTTYIVRPRIEPANSPLSSSRISSGSRQLFVGPASSSRGGADEGAVLDARHVPRVGASQVGVGALLLGEALEGARRRSASGRGRRTPPRSRRTSGRRRALSARRRARPSRSGSYWRSRRSWLGSSGLALLLIAEGAKRNPVCLDCVEP